MSLCKWISDQEVRKTGKSNITKSHKGREMHKSHGLPPPEGIWYIKEKEPELYRLLLSKIRFKLRLNLELQGYILILYRIIR